MTASLQPLDSGIIKSFKAQYRKLQLQKMVELADAHLPTELRLDYAVRYCKMAWDSVSPDSISNCWNHTGIRFTSTAAVEPLNYGNLLDRIRDIFAITPENLMTERDWLQDSTAVSKPRLPAKMTMPYSRYDAKPLFAPQEKGRKGTRDKVPNTSMESLAEAPHIHRCVEAATLNLGSPRVGCGSSASTPDTWLPQRRRRSLHLFEAAAEILEMNHRILQPVLKTLRVMGDCRFLRPPELLAPTRWLGWRIGELTGPPPNITIATRGALADAAALGSFCSRLVTQNARGRHRVASLADEIVVRGTTTAFQRLTTRTARRMLERPRLAALPITQLLARSLSHVSIPISISWSTLRRCAYSGHNSDVAVRLALHALPNPAHPASAQESCIACGSGDLSLAHRYWSCRRIRLVIVEAFTIIQRPPDLQSWIFGHDLEDDALAIMASAKTRIYKHFLGLEMQGPAADGGHANFCRNWADYPEQEDQLIGRQDVIFTKVGGSKKRRHDPDHAKSGAKKGCVQAPGMLLNSSRPRATPRPSKVHECQTTRQKQATFRERSAAGQADQCVYLEFCPDFTQEQYLRALEAKLGKGIVYQLTKMEGHILAGLSSVQLADKLIEEGLDIEDATLRAFSLRKRAERIVLGNVLFFVENADLVAALRPYGQVTSMIQKMMQLEDSCWAYARRKAFITLRDGVKLSQIPARLEVKSMGMVTHVYVTYGIKCSLCHKQEHKCANCPCKSGLQEDKLVLH
ncbi:PDC2, partial [Cordylochernes scorpioides]